MGLRRFVLLPVVVLLVAGLLVTLLTGELASWSRSALYAAGLWTDGGASTIAPTAFGHPVTAASPKPEPQAAPSAVLVRAVPGPAPAAARVAARLAAVDRTRLKGRVSGLVVDVSSGKVLFAEHSRTALVPASTTKLLTAATALSVLGPEHRFTTKVVRAAAGGIVLVGGGDPYLRAGSRGAPAGGSLWALAQQTAAQLKKAQVTRVTLGYDASLFSGPAWSADWPNSYRDQVTPVSALWIGEGRAHGGSGVRVADPAREATRAFAIALAANGISVSRVLATKAPRGAERLGSVSSMPLAGIVERVLMVSDNDGAEVLARQASIGARRSGSAASAHQVAESVLTRLGAWDPGTVLRDGSGLSRRTRISADAEVRLLRLALQEGHPELRALLTGLPVAGVEGSLQRRFATAQSLRGRGLVRGKTGTLTEANALAGYLLTADGSLLAFSFLVNDAKDGLTATAWLDAMSTALTRCGCR